MRILLAVAAALAAAWLAACAFLFVWPGDDSPRRADAIVVLAGGRKQRLAKALELVDAGVSRTLVISDGRDPAWPEANRLCDGVRPELTVVCFRPEPYSTRGEAQAVARLSRQRGWQRVAVVTSRFHVFRARILFERCVDGDVEIAGAPYRLSFIPQALVSETAKLVYAVTVGRGC